MTDLETRRRQLAEAMDERGAWPERSPWIREAVGALPRHGFAPDRLWAWGAGGLEPVDRGADPDRWAGLVYGGPDEAAVTEAGHGVPASSLSCQAVVVDMLDLLHVEPGHRVLELGAGTGWNAALLAYRAGPGRVTTVDVDAGLVAAAQRRLDSAGLGVQAVTGDGLAGRPEGAPFDRLIATFAVDTVPWAWVEQTAPGGRIVYPWGRLGHVALDVAPDGRSAQGWVQGLGQFMPARGKVEPAWGAPPGWARRWRVSQRLDPLHDDWHLRFAVRALLPDVLVRAERRPEGVGVWVHDGTSHAVLQTTVDGAQVAFETGPRRLAREVLAAWDWWEGADRPDLYEWGVTVTADGQRVWCRDPGSVVEVPVGALVA